MRSRLSRLIRAAAVLAIAILLTGCPADDDPASPTTAPGPTLSPEDGIDRAGDPDRAVDPGPTGVGGSLEAIASACADGDGRVLVEDSIRASNTDIDLPDCEIWLAPGVGMDVSAVSITGGHVLIRNDRAQPGVNLLDFRQLSINVQSFALDLNHPDDAFRAQRISITTNGEIDLRVGDRSDGGEGGTIHLIETSLTTTAEDSTVQLLASARSGTVRLERSSIDTPGTPRFVGADCVAEVNDETMACTP